MIKGDKIRLKAKMGVFDNIGEICEVTDVNDGGVICFRFGNGRHLGCMSFDEYEKYFELVEAEPIKRVWTKWKPCYLHFYDTDGYDIDLDVLFRKNDKRVQVKLADGSIKASATCRNDDEFSLAKGLDLAEKRLIVKYLAREVKEYADSL